MRRWSLLLAVASLVLARPAGAGDPTLVWRTVESRHFAVHYPEPLGRLARKVALAAERAHATLAPALDHAPRERVQIVLTDDTDSANGFASVLPRDEIRLYVTAPSDLSALDDHDDWIYDLVTHEYVHILHLDSIGGIPWLYNKVFGKSWAPNQLQPRWIVEGLATYQESKRSAAGRTRHGLFDTNLRIATLTDTELRLDELSNGPRAWPHGNSAYLYGSHFLKYVFDRHGDDQPARMSWAYGAEPIPYGVNRSIWGSTGETFVELWAGWRRHREAKYGLQAEAVARAGRREGRRLTFTGEVNYSPRYSADGRRLIWQRSDGYSRGQLRAMPVGGDAGAGETYAIIERAGEFDLLPDGSLVIEQTHAHRTQYDFQDLFLWDRATGALTAITEGARATDPAVSPDGRTVAFVINGEGRRRLALAPLRPDAPIRVVWDGGDGAQAFGPAWSPDGRALAFSAWRAGGYRNLVLLDVASGRARELTHDRAQDGAPAWSPDGAWLYWASDRTGIYNVFAHELATGAERMVTDVLGAALAPAVSPDGRRLAYQGYAEAGYEIFELDLDPARFRPAPAYVDDRPDPIRIRDDEAWVSAPRPYRPLATLAPQSWTLELRETSFGRALSATTGGSDAAGHHGYELAATTALDEARLNLGVSYAYRRMWPSFRIAAGRTSQRRAGYVIDGLSTRYVEEALSGTASIGLPVLREPDGSATISLDYDVDVVRPVDAPARPLDPSQTVPRLPRDERTAGLSLRLGYGHTDGYTYTVGPQRGFDTSLSLRLNHEALGAERASMQLGYRVTSYLQLPFAVPSTLMGRLAGGLRASATGTGGFSLGGVGEQDVVQSLLDELRAGSTGYLRGYPAALVSGDQYHLLNAEWRQELWSPERGLATLPVYLRRLHVAGLFDAGDAFDGPFEASRIRTAVGGAVRLDFLLGYFVGGTFELGYARGLGPDGGGEGWLLLTGTL